MKHNKIKDGTICLNEPEEGDLSVWHIPQVPMRAFRVSVKTPQEGKRLMDILAYYDLFQLDNGIKPDFSNDQGLDVFEDGEWFTWYDEDGNDIDDLEADELTGSLKPVDY